MKEILNIENYGIRLNLTSKGTYQLEIDHTYAPVSFIEAEYTDLHEAIGDIICRILNPENVYCMEDQSDAVQKAYRLAGIYGEEEPSNSENDFAETVYTFLETVLEGIINPNIRKEK